MISARAELGKRALAMESMPATICNTLNYNNYGSTLSIITTLSGDHATLESLRAIWTLIRNCLVELNGSATKLKADMVRLLKWNSDLEADFRAKEFD